MLFAIETPKIETHLHAFKVTKVKVSTLSYYETSAGFTCWADPSPRRSKARRGGPRGSTHAGKTFDRDI